MEHFPEAIEISSDPFPEFPSTSSARPLCRGKNTRCGNHGEMWEWSSDHYGSIHTIVAWNMTFIFPFSWECHHPNSLLLFRGVGIPPTRYGFCF